MVLIVATGIAHLDRMDAPAREAPRARPAAGGRGEPVKLRPAWRRNALGIDVGGSSIKAGLVDIAAGRLLGELTSAPTPRPATPAAVIAVLQGLVAQTAGPRRPRGRRVSERDQERHRPAPRPTSTARWIGADGRAAAGARHSACRPCSSTMPMRQGWPRCAGARPRLRRHRHHADASAPASAPRCSPTAGCSRTPSSATWRCAAWTRRSGRRRRCAPLEKLDFPAWIERVNEYLAAHARGCSGRTCSSWGAR